MGAKNHGVIMPDANKEATLTAVSFLAEIQVDICVQFSTNLIVIDTIHILLGVTDNADKR